MSNPPPSSLLSIRDLRVEFRSRGGVVRAVDGVSFDVQAGEVVALVGESGCGKSATAYSILRLIAEPGRISGGQIHFEGADLLALPEAHVRQVRGNRIAMIFQEPMSSLNPVQRIGDQVGEPLVQHGLATRRQARAKAVELLRSVNIPAPEARAQDYPHHFSGGMRQRVMIAMAMACGPRLIIADEPTTALDVTVQAQIIELLRQSAQAHGTGLLLITHNLAVVARYVDRVCVMYGGRVVESASADDLFEHPGHPYTQGLLKSVPTLDQEEGGQLEPVAGQPFDPLHRPTGCTFHPRCPQAQAVCREQAPPECEPRPGHRVACWLAHDASQGSRHAARH
ncbi:MAG: ABC transporter ATP-binding protein [Acidovorax sp.]